MKKLLVVLGLLVLVPGLALAQVGTSATTYYVDYYANNAGAASVYDQVVRIINVGTLGTPLTVPVGDICANIYVFDADQELQSCCAERLTPNELDAAFVGVQLTGINPGVCIPGAPACAGLPVTLTGVAPASGVIKIALTPDPTGAACDPRNALTGADATEGVVFGTHLQTTGGFVFVTETEKTPSILSAGEAGFLPQACSFAVYLGSGRGQCWSSVSTGLH